MNLLSKAIALAATAFEKKFDNGGSPYIMHLIRVMNGVDQSDSELMQIAVLHDLIEDTDYFLDDLISMGYSIRVTSALDLLTHREWESYESYIERLSVNKDAVAVKLSDLRDNTDITRLKGLRKKDFKRMEKYHRAWVYLNSVRS